MQFVPVPSSALARLRYICDGQECFNTLWFQMDDSSSYSALYELGRDLLEWWSDNMAGLLGTGITLQDVEVSDQSSQTGPVAIYVPPTPTGGGLIGDMSPNNVSWAISFKTARRGRQFRGRNFIVGISETRTGSSYVQQAWAEEVQAAYTLLKGSSIVGPGAIWSVVSRFSGKDSAGKPLPRAVGIATPVTQVTFTDLVVDSQRRRLPKRGK